MYSLPAFACRFIFANHRADKFILAETLQGKCSPDRHSTRFLRQSVGAAFATPMGLGQLYSDTPSITPTQ